MSSPRATSPAPPAHPAEPGRAARTSLILAVPSAVLLLLVAVSWSPLISFDREVADWLHRSAVDSPGAVRVNRILTDWLWDPWTMRALIAAACVVLWWRGERLLAVWVAAVSATSSALQQLVKWSVGRERPQWTDPVDSAHFAAFPSGHALQATVTCALLLWLLRLHGVTGRWWRWSVAAAVISVAGVGVTRLYLGVHWPTDVLAGWLMGSCWVMASIAVYHRVLRARRRRRSDGAAPA
ncbi:phosphatase PAP2 family protein [Streptomyces sp. CAU 1734]|uniref:phosphatase PAP2 family protein n=1 Tax=Streptomyces sp. CAU 1734 TaxID=3140360 RepID=UPI0032616260